MTLDVRIIIGMETGNAARAPTMSVQVMNLIHIVQMKADTENAHTSGSNRIEKLPAYKNCIKLGKREDVFYYEEVTIHSFGNVPMYFYFPTTILGI